MNDNKTLLANFITDMRNLYTRERDVIGSSNGFLWLMDEYGEVEAAKMMLGTDEHMDGFTRLYLAGHPELTVEYLILLIPITSTKNLSRVAGISP